MSVGELSQIVAQWSISRSWAIIIRSTTSFKAAEWILIHYSRGIQKLKLLQKVKHFLYSQWLAQFLRICLGNLHFSAAGWKLCKHGCYNSDYWGLNCCDLSSRSSVQQKKPKTISVKSSSSIAARRVLIESGSHPSWWKLRLVRIPHSVLEGWLAKCCRIWSLKSGPITELARPMGSTKDVWEMKNLRKYSLFLLLFVSGV